MAFFAEKHFCFGASLKVASVKSTFILPNENGTMLEPSMYSMMQEGVNLESPMNEVYRLAHKASQSSANVLILGESGVGKEYLARKIHRSRAPDEAGFRVYRCSSSELDFGKIRGLICRDFNGATDQFQCTVFLKSLERISDRNQFQLLEVLDEEKIGRLLQGTFTFRKPRMICSSEKAFDAKQGGNELLLSLLYHLDIIHIEIPPLRERKAEILFLANLFLQEFKIKYGKNISGFSLETRQRLIDYDWPGNVRELRRAVEEAVIISQGRIVESMYFL